MRSNDKFHSIFVTVKNLQCTNTVRNLKQPQKKKKKTHPQHKGKQKEEDGPQLRYDLLLQEHNPLPTNEETIRIKKDKTKSRKQA